MNPILMILFWPFMLIGWIIRKIIDMRYNIDFSDYPDDNEEEIQKELSQYENLPEMPEMSQVFHLGPDYCVGVEYVSMCPDETAHIRIIGDTTFSQLYKRRVYTEKTYGKERYFKLNGQKYYLDDKRTKPITPIMAKPGK